MSWVVVVGFHSLLNRLLVLQSWMVLHMNAHSENLFIFIPYLTQPVDGNSPPALWLGCKVTQQEWEGRRGRELLKLVWVKYLAQGVLAQKGIEPEALLPSEDDLCNRSAAQESIMRSHARVASQLSWTTRIFQSWRPHGKWWKKLEKPEVSWKVIHDTVTSATRAWPLPFLDPTKDFFYKNCPENLAGPFTYYIYSSLHEAAALLIAPLAVPKIIFYDLYNSFIYYSHRLHTFKTK